MEERSPSPPPMQAPVDRRVSNLRRRSSMGQSVRKSRSIIGLPFEDQIAAIGKNIDIFALAYFFQSIFCISASTASIEQKLLQITSTSWSTAARLVQHEYDNQDATEDNPQADLADHVAKTLGRLMIKNETLQSVKQKVQEMVQCSDDAKPPKIIPPRLKKLHAQLDLANSEIDQWRDLHHARKNKFNTTKLEKRQVLNGEKMVTNADRENLPKAEDAWLRGLSDGHVEWKKVSDQEIELEMAKRDLQLKLAMKRKALSEMETEIDVMAAKIKKYSETTNTHMPEMKSLAPPQDSDFII